MPIYLDHNATAPLNPAAIEALSVFLGLAPQQTSQMRSEPQKAAYYNPSSIHSFGRRAKRILAEVRESVAASLGPSVDHEQLIFTSSGTEANQLAIRSILEPLLRAGKRPHWITTSVEHDSVLQMKTWLEERGGRCSLIPVDSDGRIQVEKLSEIIEPDTALVSAVWVNNETGVITNVAEIASQTRARRIPLHLDAAQAWGKLPIDLAQVSADLVSVSGHKIGALSGTGVLWVGRGIPIQGAILGKQEKGRRGGSENLAGIVSLGAAARHLPNQQNLEKIATLRDRLQHAMSERIPGLMINGKDAPRVSNTLNVSIDGIEGDGLIMALDLEGFAVSAGSACSSGALEPSHVLMAMGRTKNQALAAVRVSLSANNTWEELEAFVDALERVVNRFRNRNLK